MPLFYFVFYCRELSERESQTHRHCVVFLEGILASQSQEQQFQSNTNVGSQTTILVVEANWVGEGRSLSGVSS